MPKFFSILIYFLSAFAVTGCVITPPTGSPVERQETPPGRVFAPPSDQVESEAETVASAAVSANWFSAVRVKYEFQFQRGVLDTRRCVSVLKPKASRLGRGGFIRCDVEVFGEIVTSVIYTTDGPFTVDLVAPDFACDRNQPIPKHYTNRLGMGMTTSPRSDRNWTTRSCGTDFVRR